MELSIFIAKILAVIYLSFGVGLIISGDYYKKALGKVLDNASFLIYGGISAIILGALIIENHNLWVKNWTVLITIIGRIALIKGVFLLAFPRLFSFFNPLLKSEKLIMIIAPLVIIVGLIFGYFGFFA